MNIYKPSGKVFIINIIAIFILLFTILLFKGNYETIKLTISIIILFYLISLFLKKRLINISIDKTKGLIHLKFSQYALKLNQETHRLGDIKYSFDYETGPKGTNRKVFRITKASEVIVKIIPNIDGWSHLKINQIIEDLRISQI